MTVILIGFVGLGNAETAGRPILRLLDVLLSAETKLDAKKTILEKDFDIPMTVAMSEEANIMCNLGEGIREQAYEKGLTQGREEGIEEKSIECFLNLINEGMPKEKAQRLIKIRDDLVEKALSLQKS